jgi:proline dehydrogenase
VRIDMEDSSCTDATLGLYRELREARRDNVGIVLQSCLKRSLDDVAALAGVRPNVRLCKGIYIESEEIAYRDPDEVRASYLRILDALLEAGSNVALATQDEWLIRRALERVAGKAPTEYEIQFLLGVRSDRAAELVAAGHRLRVYVPYGDRWYEYSTRRLQENPAIAWTIAKATLGRMVPRRG